MLVEDFVLGRVKILHYFRVGNEKVRIMGHKHYVGATLSSCKVTQDSEYWVVDVSFPFRSHF